MEKNENIILKSALGERDIMFQAMPNGPEGRGIRSMPEILSSVAKMEEMSYDMLIPNNKIDFVSINDTAPVDDTDVVPYKNLLLGQVDSDNQLLLTNWSMGQIGNTYGVPPSYLRRCIAEGSGDFAALNLNYWKSRVTDDKTFLARITGNRLQGFLSNNYQPFDDSHLLNLVASSIQEADPHGSYFVSNATVSPEATKLRIVSPVEMEIEGRPYHIGLDISNSRVGQRSVHVALIVYCQVCTNGLVVGREAELIHKRHLNIDPLEIQNQIVSLIRMMPTLLNDLRDSITLASAQQLSHEQLNSLQDKFRLQALRSDAAVLAIEEMMITTYNQSLMGYINAISEVAQAYSLATRESMEKFAGNLLRRGIR